jgi:hypothetical protein
MKTMISWCMCYVTVLKLIYRTQQIRDFHVQTHFNSFIFTVHLAWRSGKSNHLIKILNLYENIRYNAEIYRYIRTATYRHVCWFNIDVRIIRRQSVLCKQKLYFRFRHNEAADMYSYKTHFGCLHNIIRYGVDIKPNLSMKCRYFCFLWTLFNVALKSYNIHNICYCNFKGLFKSHDLF